MGATRKGRGRALSGSPHISEDQAWFWTREWQVKEREADEALAAGRYSEFSEVDDLIINLNN